LRRKSFVVVDMLNLSENLGDGVYLVEISNNIYGLIIISEAESEVS